MYPLTAQIAARAAGTSLSPDERSRYSRHLLLPDVGLEGQLRLKAARVLVVGLGGLGAPVGLYLAAAGVGTLGLVDFDHVDLSNLQRQILYTQADLGAAKVSTAAARLLALNSAVQIHQHAAPVAPDNALELLAGYDLVIDGTDNFATRYLLSDACVQLAKPYIYGSILRFAGQASVFYAPHGPCYRCLFPRAPQPGQVPSCAEGGVLGVLPGQIGAIQATEALKLILGIGTSLLGRLLTLDALTMQVAEFRLARDPTCPACGEHADLAALAAAEASCQIAFTEAAEGPFAPIDVHAYQAMRSSGTPHTLIDVRTAGEAQICRIAGSRLIPLAELAQLASSLPRDLPLIVHCKSGGRSAQAVQLLREAGLPSARSLSGGILAWAAAYAPGLARY